MTTYTHAELQNNSDIEDMRQHMFDMGHCCTVERDGGKRTYSGMNDDTVWCHETDESWDSWHQFTRCCEFIG